MNKLKEEKKDLRAEHGRRDLIAIFKLTMYVINVKPFRFSVLFLVAGYFCEETFEESSRRLCNMAYVLWICTLMQPLYLFAFVADRLMISEEKNIIVEAITYN